MDRLVIQHSAEAIAFLPQTL